MSSRERHLTMIDECFDHEDRLSNEDNKFLDTVYESVAANDDLSIFSAGKLLDLHEKYVGVED
ncbi:MAG: hypothetical protein GQ570_03745 [Helicobacteraceae bacterium]|nr:hypothetical protein [Helicobacteraceae bacterium]